MASQFFETAIVNFRNKKHFIVPTVSSFDNSIETTGEDGEQVFVNREAYASQIQTDVLVSQQSVTSISSAVLVSGGITDFNTGLNHNNIWCLHWSGADSRLYAGTENGGIYGYYSVGIY